MKAHTRLARYSVSIVLLVTGCTYDHGIIDPATTGDIVGANMASERFSDWSQPVNLGDSVNTAATENTPEISKDGLSLYFGSPRPGGSGSNDLWVAHRACTDPNVVDCTWQKAVNLGATVNSRGIDAGPELTRDGHRLFFTSATGPRGDEERSHDIYMSTRPCTHAVGCPWEEPVNMGSPINTFEFEGGPSIRGTELYFNRGDVPGAPPVEDSPASDIWVSRIESGIFGTPTLVIELSIGDPVVDQRPSIRFDGQEIFLSSNRTGGEGSHDLWVSTRPGNDQPWTTPVNLGSPINTEFEENHPSISPDGTMLFFASRRPSPGEDCSVCDLDLYVATRTVLPKE
jgi:hypothetical protein